MTNSDRKWAAKSARTAFARRDLLRGAAVAGIAAASGLAPAKPAQAEVWEEGEEQCRVAIQEKDPSYDVDDALLAAFMEVSRTLTGTPLASISDLRLGRQYLERYARVAELTDLLPQLIKAHVDLAGPTKPSNADAVADALMKNPAIRPAAEQLIYLWYLSAFYLPLGGDPAKRLWIYGTTEQYERALLWTAVHAHAPMTRAGKPGDWARAPQV